MQTVKVNVVLLRRRAATCPYDPERRDEKVEGWCSSTSNAWAISSSFPCGPPTWDLRSREKEASDGGKEGSTIHRKTFIFVSHVQPLQKRGSRTEQRKEYQRRILR
jgi:hypothetical protein